MFSLGRFLSLGGVFKFMLPSWINTNNVIPDVISRQLSWHRVLSIFLFVCIIVKKIYYHQINYFVPYKPKIMFIVGGS